MIQSEKEIERLCIQWSGLPKYVVNRFFAPRLSAKQLYVAGGFGELQSVGRVGLFHAARQFDPARGVQFNTYAVVAIRRTIDRHLVVTLRRPDGVPGHLVEDLSLMACRHRPAWEIAEDNEEIAYTLRRLDSRQQQVIRGRLLEGKSLKEIGEELGISRERVRQLEQVAMRRLNGMASMTV